MKRLIPLIALLLALCLGLAACGGETAATVDGSASGGSTEAGGNGSAADAAAQPAATLEDPASQGLEATGDFQITTGDGSVSQSGSVYTLTAAGEYSLSGALAEGQIVIAAGAEDELKLNLENVSISCSAGAPIQVLEAGEVTLHCPEGSYNSVTDLRSGDPTALETETNDDAAVWAACDLKLTGKGTLIVSSEFDNGVKTKDDLRIKNLTLKVTAPGNALKGSDSVTIHSGALLLISTGSDGIKSSNSDLSSKGNQRGIVTISGGQVDIYAARDGVDAAYDVVIDESEAPVTLNIRTASYAELGDSAGTALYLVVPQGLYSEATDYWALFYNDEPEQGVWKQCSYETMIYSGRTGYYGLLCQAPEGYENLLFQTLPAGSSPDGSNYSASTGGETRNSAMNGYLLSQEGDQLSGDWVQISTGSDSAKTTYSSKGIKAANRVTIAGGAVTVYSMDDGIHANGGEALENGETGLGDVDISGGALYLTSADDGIHADGNLHISGGDIQVPESHEGLEANVISLSGGRVYVNADDDGLNACSGNQTPLIHISGGYVEVTTPSGDTDGIDSNGSISISGGFVLVKGGASVGGMAGSIDVDGSITATGGTVVALGGICETPSNGAVCTYVSGSVGLSAGEYKLLDQDGATVLSFALESSYSGLWISSEDLQTGGSYRLLRGEEEVLSWTQSGVTEGDSGFGGGFGGGWGGRGGRR